MNHIQLRKYREHLGLHPLNGLPLLKPRGRICGQCVHHVIHEQASVWHKCDLMAITHGPKTDIRVGWPACCRFVAAPEREVKPASRAVARGNSESLVSAVTEAPR